MSRKKPRMRGVRRPEQLPSGSWRAWTYDRSTQRKGPGRTFPGDQYTQALSWMTHEQAVMDGIVPAEQSLLAAATAATELLAAARMATEQMTPGPWPRSNVATAKFADWVTEWAATSADTYNTQKTRESHARQLAAYWPTQAVAEISTADVRAMLADMRRAGKSNSLRGCRLSALRGAMVAGIERGYCHTDPTRPVKAPPSEPSREKHVPTPTELDLIITHLPDYLKPAVLLCRHSGLRLGEVAALRWRHIDLTGDRNSQRRPAVLVAATLLPNGEIQPHPKGRKHHQVPLSGDTVAALKEHRERYGGGPEDLLFRSRVCGRQRNERGRIVGRTQQEFGGDQPISMHRWEDLWQAAREAAQLPAPLPRWHDLRHGLGHDLHAAGAPAYVIQGMLRHGKIETSRIYMPDVSLDMAADWSDKIRGDRPDPEPPPLRIVS